MAVEIEAVLDSRVQAGLRKNAMLLHSTSDRVPCLQAMVVAFALVCSVT